MPCKIVIIDGRKVRICWDEIGVRQTALEAGGDETDRKGLAAALSAVLQPLGLAVVELPAPAMAAPTGGLPPVREA